MGAEGVAGGVWAGQGRCPQLACCLMSLALSQDVRLSLATSLVPSI